MLIKSKIPFVNENEIMRKALKILNIKKLGFLVITNNQNQYQEYLLMVI